MIEFFTNTQWLQVVKKFLSISKWYNEIQIIYDNYCPNEVISVHIKHGNEQEDERLSMMKQIRQDIICWMIFVQLNSSHILVFALLQTREKVHYQYGDEKETKYVFHSSLFALCSRSSNEYKKRYAIVLLSSLILKIWKKALITALQNDSKYFTNTVSFLYSRI